MRKSHRLINDTIYQHIEYTKLEDKFLQTKVLNRLLFITQNALAYFAFPSISTKRYIHSIGTMHLSSHMLKNSLLNCDDDLVDEFLRSLNRSIDRIIVCNDLDISLQNLDFLDDKSLYEFIIPTQSTVHNNTYILVLQALRLVGLLHDVGHFPFSHQVEYALQKIYQSLQTKTVHSEKEQKFIKFYNSITDHGQEVLHEAIGKQLVDVLFEHELPTLLQTQYDKDYMILLHELCKNILGEKDDGIFDYKVLHRYVDGTVDADRLDYINRDMLSSGYISGPVDHIRITKQAILIRYKNNFKLTFYDEGLLDIEHMLEMRFNLYKKIIYNHKIALSDAVLENVVMFLSQDYFTHCDASKDQHSVLDSISMLWSFLDYSNKEKQLDIISQMDENWMITLFKKEYFKIKYQENRSQTDQKYLLSFEEVLFGKNFFKSVWKNLNDLYSVLEFSKVDRYKFRESFGNVSAKKMKKLQLELDTFVEYWQKKEKGAFFTYRIVSFKTGIAKDFSLYDGEKLIAIDEVSTLRKRLKKSMQNTVPFFIYTNQSGLNMQMRKELKSILFTVL
ncbi:MAG: hypothetical protein U9N30_07075 [Campylobacterota bacterium]|nr:hypothetical protein [Campylobacterota bacterium]